MRFLHAFTCFALAAGLAMAAPTYAKTKHTAHKKHHASAQSHTLEDPQLPSTPPLTPDWLMAHGDQIYSAKVTARLGLSDQNPTWELRHTHVAMLVTKLQEFHPGKTPTAPLLKPDPNLALLEKAPSPQQDADSYLGLSITLGLADGTTFPPLIISRGKILSQGSLWAKDTGRQLEYWLFSTARIRRDLLLGSQVLPVVTFEQCRMLGNQIINTTPRQCLLPNNDILLDLHEPLTEKALHVTSYQQCLSHGAALIYTFPRRCMVAGGHVFTEPPVVEDPIAKAEAEAAKTAPSTTLTPTEPTLPADTNTPSLKDMLDTSTTATPPEPVTPSVIVTPTAMVTATIPLSPTTPAKVSPTALTPSPTATITQPGLGFYAVPTSTTPVKPSATTPTSPTTATTPPTKVSPIAPAASSPSTPSPTLATPSSSIPQESLADLLKSLPSPTTKAK